MTLERVRIERPRVTILGTRVDRLTMAETLTALQEFIESKQPHIVVTADASGVVQAQGDEELRKIYDEADLVTPDSEGILLGAKIKKAPISEKVSGVELVSEICRMSADHGYRIYLLGSSPGIAEMAMESLKLRYPGCNIVGARHGFFPADSFEVVAQEVAELKPDVLFVAMGIPRQEKFIARTQSIIQAPVAIGVGGSLDVFSGQTKRAPKVVQKIKLEWLWRLILNPSKIAKAKNLPIFLFRVLFTDRNK